MGRRKGEGKGVERRVVEEVGERREGEESGEVDGSE